MFSLFIGDATLSRFAGIDLKHVKMQSKVSQTPSGEVSARLGWVCVGGG